MILGLICPKLDILGQNNENLCKNRKKLENICHIRICLCIDVKLYTVVLRKIS